MIDFNQEYKIDVSKPPIFPPIREIHYGIFGEFQTKRSRKLSKKWSEYIKEYGKILKEKNKIRVSSNPVGH